MEKEFAITENVNKFVDLIFEILDLELDSQIEILKLLSKNKVEDFFNNIKDLEIKEEEKEKIQALKEVIYINNMEQNNNKKGVKYYGN